MQVYIHMLTYNENGHIQYIMHKCLIHLNATWSRDLECYLAAMDWYHWLAPHVCVCLFVWHCVCACLW